MTSRTPTLSDNHTTGETESEIVRITYPLNDFELGRGGAVFARAHRDGLRSVLVVADWVFEALLAAHVFQIELPLAHHFTLKLIYYSAEDYYFNLLKRSTSLFDWLILSSYHQHAEEEKKQV